MSGLLGAVRSYLAGERVPVAVDSPDRLSFPVDAIPLAWRVHVWVRAAEQQVLVHSVFPSLVPADRLDAVSRFVQRANFGLIMGNFELDLDDGEVRYKTSVEVGDLHPGQMLLRPLFVANIGTCHRYFPGLAAVIDGASADAQIELIEA